MKKLLMLLSLVIGLSYTWVMADELKPFQFQGKEYKRHWPNARMMAFYVWNEQKELYGECKLIQGKLDKDCPYIQSLTVSNGEEAVDMEHILPSSWYRHQVTCGIYGFLRDDCSKDDGYVKFETDLRNLMPVPSALNKIKSDDPFCEAVLSGDKIKTYASGFIAVINRKVESPKGMVKGCIIPPIASRGPLARIQLAMAYEYDIPLPADYEEMLLKWTQSSVTDDELLRKARIDKIMGIVPSSLIPTR